MENEILAGLNMTLNAIAQKQKELAKEMTPKQRLKYSKFQNELAILMKAGDMNGIEKLKENFKAGFND